MSDLAKAIKSLYPDAQFAIEDNSIDKIKWFANKPNNFNVSDVTIELDKLIQLEQNLLYKRERAKEYPSIQEQLDMQYWDSVNGTTTWQDTINAIKAKYPKPEGV